MESTRKYHGTKKKNKVSSFNGFICSFFGNFFVFLTVRICGLGHGFSLHVVIAWIKFDFVLLMLLIFID
jgi:hypothetical protein